MFTTLEELADMNKNNVNLPTFALSWFSLSFE